MLVLPILLYLATINSSETLVEYFWNMVSTLIGRNAFVHICSGISHTTIVTVIPRVYESTKVGLMAPLT